MAITEKNTADALSLARAVVDTSHIPLLLFDGGLRVVLATQSFCSAFAIDPSEPEGRTLSELGQGEWNIPQLRVLLNNALAMGPDMGDYETDVLGPRLIARRVIVNVQNIVYDDKQNARILMTIHDVTGVRRAEQMNVALLLEKDSLLLERSFLLQEMQHRVANSLQIIASVLLLKARTVESEETRRHLRDAHDRVMSVAAVQHHLQASLGDVDVGPYLTKLCESLAASMIRDPRSIKLHVRADAATVNSHEAVSLGLIVTELVINALKHAFPTGRSGEVWVSYQLDAKGWTLSVTDNGVGRSPVPSGARVGLGTSLVQALAQQLRAAVVLSDAAPGARISIVNADGPVRLAPPAWPDPAARQDLA